MALPIKQYRKKNKLTQKVLAGKLGVSIPTIVNWESGRNAPRGKNLAKVQSLLGVKPAAPKKAAKKAAPKPKKKAGRPKGKVGRPKKVAAKAKAPKKRGRPKGSKTAKPTGVSAQLSGVAKDLGFANVDEMVKTILRKHKIGKLDL